MTTDRSQIHDEDVLGRVRALVRDLLEAGAAAPAISYSLAYVAAEFGFHAADDAHKVIPVVLSAISRATAEEIPDDPQPEAAPVDERELRVPEGATLH